MREFERAIERGEDTAVATFVLEQLRKIVRGADEDDEARPRIDDPARLLFRPLEPFLVDGNFPIRPGRSAAHRCSPVWQWLTRDGAPEAAREFEAALAASRQSGTTAGHRAGGRANSSSPPPTPSSSSPRRCPATTSSGRSPASVRPTSSRICCRSARCCRRARRWKRFNGKLPSYLRVFGESADRLDHRRAQRALAANAAVAAVRAVADHAAADRALADHPPRHQDGRIRRRDPRCRDALWRCRHHRAARSVLPRRLPAHRHQARAFRQRCRTAQVPA